ncbi:MAG: aminoacyl-tRNA hydrolase [Candidatus Dojkabacteria bacterium]
MDHKELQEQFSIDRIKVIVGLGNLGKAYVNTRHNVGFDFIEKMADSRRFLEEPKLKSLIHMADFGGYKRIFIEPSTQMNLSGEAVSLVANFYKVEPSEILVVHDDLDLRLGSYKIQLGKGPKIHNGLLSIQNRLGTSKFWRIRVGVDNREVSTRDLMSGADYVLGHFKVDEVKMLEEVFYNVRKELLERNLIKAEN